jgi:hypothetical protein
VWILCAAARQVEIAPDIGHARCGRRKLPDEIEDAVSLKLVVHKPRLCAGEAIEMTADRAAAREQFAGCTGAGILASQLFSQLRELRF